CSDRAPHHKPARYLRSTLCPASLVVNCQRLHQFPPVVWTLTISVKVKGRVKVSLVATTVPPLPCSTCQRNIPRPSRMGSIDQALRALAPLTLSNGPCQRAISYHVPNPSPHWTIVHKFCRFVVLEALAEARNVSAMAGP